MHGSKTYYKQYGAEHGAVYMNALLENEEPHKINCKKIRQLIAFRRPPKPQQKTENDIAKIKNIKLSFVKKIH